MTLPGQPVMGRPRQGRTAYKPQVPAAPIEGLAMRSKWRTILFSALVALSLGFSVFFYEFPQIDTSSFDSSSAPLTIGVYVTDPNMRLSIQFEVFHDPSGRVKATLFIRNFTKGTILLTSTM